MKELGEILGLFVLLCLFAYWLGVEQPLMGLREALMGIISDVGEAWRGQ